MRKQRFYVTMMLACAILGARADEGMWLLQMMEARHYSASMVLSCKMYTTQP